MPETSNHRCPLHYLVEGSGNTILLIPGLGGSTSQLSSISAKLALHYRVISIDPRGAGLSGKPDIVYDGETLAADMIKVLDAAEADKVDVIGISFGGMIAQELSIRFPDRVRSLCMVSCYASSDSWTDRMWKVRKKTIRELGMTEHFKLAMMFLFSPRSFRDETETISKLEAAFASSPPDPVGYLRQLEYCHNHNPGQKLSQIKVPTLVITGSEDILSSPVQGRELAEAIPGAQYLEIPEVSHLFMISSPDYFADLVHKSLQANQNRESTLVD